MIVFCGFLCLIAAILAIRMDRFYVFLALMAFAALAIAVDYFGNRHG